MVPEKEHISSYSSSAKNVVQGSSVDDGVLDNLSKLISSLNDQGESKNFQQLITFFQRGFVSQVVQVWSYYAQVNNHPKFSKATTLLVNTLRLLAADQNVHEYGSGLIELILSGHLKVLYRGLNNIRASITNPILRLMKEMVCFNSGQHIELFVSNFDLALSSLPKILSVNKADLLSTAENVNKNSRLSIRFAFIDFWLELISLSPCLLRKQLILDNFKIMSAWFKLMDKLDTPELMCRTLDVFMEKILGEPSFKRMTKSKVLNELALSKIHSFYYSKDKKLVKKVDSFFLAYGSNEKTGVAFPDDAVWFSESPFNGTHKGAVVSVNQKQFKVYNKLLFNVLKFFKPWEDDTQLNTVLKILDHVPELVAPYCNFLATHGSHDPKMTSYWFGCTMILGRIIRLKVPIFMEQVETDLPPSISLVMESVIPSPLSKLALTKSLQHEKQIIRQLACQLMVFAFQKLELVLHLYDRKGWASAKSTLRNAFHLHIADLPIISSVMNQSYISNKSNKILQLSLSTILKYYSVTFPNFFTMKLPSSNIFVDIMQSDDFSGIDLALLNNFLQFQELNGIQTKWWNTSSQKRSIFTSLLNVALTAPASLTEKICQILRDMFRGSVAFDKLLCPPQRALVHSLRIVSTKAAKEDMERIWKLLDTTIEHFMRTPYRYVDMSAQYDRISPFVMAVVEQWEYSKLESESDLVANWLSLYLRTMVICGESEQGVKLVSKNHLSNVWNQYIDAYLGNTPRNHCAQIELEFQSNIMESSFFEFITLKPYHEMKNISRCPTSKLDAAGLLFRVQMLLRDDSVKFDSYFKSTIHDLLTKLMAYATTDPSFSFKNAKIFELFVSKINLGNRELVGLKGEFAAHLMVNLHHELELSSPDLGSLVFTWLQDNRKYLQELDPESSVFLASLCTFLSVSESIRFLQDNDAMAFALKRQIVGSLLKLPDGTVPFETALSLLSESSAKSISLISSFIANNRVQNMEPIEFLGLALKSDEYSSAVESFVKSSYFSPDVLVPYLHEIKGTKISLIVALALANCEQTAARSFVERIVRESHDSLAEYDIATSQLALQLQCSCPNLLSEEDKSSTIKYLINGYGEKYSQAASQFIISTADFDDKEVLKWLNKLMLHITRCFSTSNSLNDQIFGTLAELQNLTEDFDVWQKVNNKVLNSQLEVILCGPWVAHPNVLKYVLHVCLCGKTPATHFGRLMQCLLNNEQNGLRLRERDGYVAFLTAAVLYTLYLGDPAHSSNLIVQENLLKCYTGTVSTQDRLILRILELIESKTSQSWTNSIYGWELVEELEGERDPSVFDLITSEKEGLVVTLERKAIIDSSIYYILDKPEIPSISAVDIKSSWKSLMSFYDQTKRSLSALSVRVYDPMFLLLLSVQNEELVKSSKTEDGTINYSFNVKGFISSNIFEIVICALADQSEVQKIAMMIVKGMLVSLQESNNFREGHIFEVLLSRIVYTFKGSETAQTDELNSIAPCIWYAISQLTLLLTQPNSPLHEKAFRWVLKSPIIRSNDIPLLQELLFAQGKIADQNNFYKQLGWVLDCLKQGLRTEQDVELMKRTGILEWLSNLMSLPYINGKMRSAVNSIFYTSQRIGSSGSTLITRVASISTFELQNVSLKYRILDAAKELENNQKNKRHLQKTLSLRQQEINTEEVLGSHAVLINSHKRLKYWTEGDGDNITKRLNK